jgi:CBS domain-containing protein
MTGKHAAKARDYMARNLVVLSPEMDVLHAISIFVEKQISGAPVLDRFGTLVGMLSEKDCMRIALAAGYYGEWGGRVQEYMTSPVTTIDADMPIVEVAQLFAEREFRRYPVMEDARLVGQISRSDVLRALQELAGAAADLRTTIPGTGS